MTERLVFDLEEQPPLPFQAADDYARLVLDWSSEVPEGVLMRRDLAYGPHRRQRYDVFAPPGATSAPILIFFHGGGWTNGYKEFTGFMAPAVTRLGMILVAPSYRLAPADPLPAAFDDGLSVLRVIAATAADFGGDPDRMYLSGHSAGGHLAALTALRHEARLHAGLSPQAIRGCLPISGIMDLHHSAPPPGSLEERVYTWVLERDTDDGVMSPICWTAGNTVPMLLSHGSRDSERVMRSNARLEALLALQPAPVERIVENERDHFQTHLDLHDPAHPWYGRLSKLVAET